MKAISFRNQFLTWVLLIFTLVINGQTFEEQTLIVLPSVSNGSTTWGDYDNDGDMDVLISGGNVSDGPVLKIFRNNYPANTFTDLGNVFTPANPNAYIGYGDNYLSAWVDFDNDGYLDIVFNGRNENGGYEVNIYKNEGPDQFNRSFSRKYRMTYLTFQGGTSFDFGDYDNDGDIDLIIVNSIASKLLKNIGNYQFEEQTSVSLNGETYSTTKFIDYDNDGDLDIIISGNLNGFALYQNQGDGSFIKQTSLNIYGGSGGTNDWADCNSDGYPDLLLNGGSTIIYKNNGNGTFTNLAGANLTNTSKSTGNWCDFDNDGDADIIITGSSNNSDITKIYINNDNETFSELSGLTMDGVSEGSVDVGDYDKDNDIDIIISGKKGPEKICKIYKNTSVTTNPVLTAPSGLTTQTSGNNLILKWNRVSGDNTNKKSLTYNVLSGIATNGIDIINPMSIPASGFRKIASIGNSQFDTILILKNIKIGSYKWKVQAIDNSFIGGPFSSEGPFTYSVSYQAGGLTLKNKGGKEACFFWTRGNGDNCIVFVKAGTSGTAVPQEYITYSASSAFGSGSQIGTTGWYCVYKGSLNNVKITALNALTDYIVQVIEFTGAAGLEQYYTEVKPDNNISFKTGIFTELTATPLKTVLSSTLGWVQSYDIFWFDYDNDNYLDVYLSSDMSEYIYKNNANGTFSEITVAPGSGPYGDCGDFNNDGNIDIANLSSSSGSISLNSGAGTFTLLPGTSIPGASYGSIDWGDYDSDGDLDLIMTGEAGSFQCITKIFRNNGDGASMTEISNHNIDGLRYGSTDWGDYDNDGLLDLAISGIKLDLSYVTSIYRNTGNGIFSKITDLTNNISKVRWGDYDNDGDLDLLLISSTQNRIYRNNGNNTFTFQEQIILGKSEYGDGTWGDYDNDGFLDLIITGFKDMYVPFTKVYTNNQNNNFTEDTNCTVTPAGFGMPRWGDFDNDGDADLLIIGLSIDSAFTKVYRNDITTSTNPTPFAPQSPKDSVVKSDVILKWKSVRTDNTPFRGISYNIKLGKTSGAIDVVSPHSFAGGNRKISQIGNANLDTTFNLKNLPLGTYYWRVQAVDNSFKGGAFSEESSFSIVPVQPTKLSARIINSSSLAVKWERGNGSRCITFCKEGSAGTAVPLNNHTYLQDAEFGYGEQIGTSGWYCIFNGRNDSVIVTGLKYKTDYSFHIIEYNGNPGSEQYFTGLVNGNPGVFSTGLFSLQTGISFSSPYFGRYEWGDYDNDGFTDVIIPGSTPVLYKNNGDNTFSSVPQAIFTAASYGSANWGDYDNDGDLDLLITGTSGFASLPAYSKIYQNDGGGIFNEQYQISFEAVYYSAADWGDYDNDGDLDLILTGATGDDPYFDPVTIIYRNNGDRTFTAQDQISLPGVFRGEVKWVDYDNDGDLDIHLSGSLDYQYYDNCFSRIYRNDGNNTFTWVSAIDLPNAWEPSADWSDYDNDGDMDLAMTTPGGLYAYENTGGSFTQILADYYGYSSFGFVTWGDYDNDGFIDILFSNFAGSARIYKNVIYENIPYLDFMVLNEESFNFTQVEGLRWCDYDNDGDIDIMVNSWGDNCKLYKNNLYMKSGLFKTNSPPAAPESLKSERSPAGINLSWNPVKTDETKFQSLFYNIKIGKTAQIEDIVSSHSLNNGFRKIPRTGNAQLDTSFLMKNMESGKYYWKVQAVDQAYMGGEWSEVDSFEVKNVQAFFSSDVVCAGYATHFLDQSVATDGIISWKWDFKDGTSSTVRNPSHIFPDGGNYNVKLVVTSTGGVKDSLEQMVIVNQRPAAGFSAPAVCQGSSSAITNTTDTKGLNISSWFWDFGDGQTSILQQPPAHGYLGAADYTVQLKALASNGCRDSITKTVTVASYPVAVITSSAALTFCKGDSVTLSVTQNNDYLYKWKLDGALITETGTNKLVAKLTGNYTVDVTNSKGNCMTVSSPVTVTAQNAPAPPTITYTGNLIFCQGDSIILSVSPSTGNTYQWKLNGGAVGSDTNRFVARNTGIYNLILSNSTGCSAASANSVSVSVKPAPLVSTINQVGETKFCKGKSAVLSVPANSAYTFSWKKGITFLDIASNSITATESGDYSVEITSNEGCIGTSDKVTIEVIEPPLKPSIDKGSYSKGMCLGENPMELKVDDIIAGYSYKWYKNEAPLSNSTSIHITEEGNYYLEAGIDICTSLRDSVNIDFMETIPKPVIDAKGPIVWYLSTASSANYYKWYYNGTIIPDAESKVYLAKQNFGLYRLAISNDNICYSFSDTLRIPYLGTTGIENPDPFADVEIYPNPTTGMFTIEMNNNIFGELVIDIITQNGSKILNIKFEKTTEHFSSQIDLSGQPKGMYLINLSLDKFKTTRKILVE
jgi:PKD repeat protein